MLTFIKIYQRKNYRPYGLYRCDCGGLTVTLMSSVKMGITKSCGCLRTQNCNAINERRRNKCLSLLNKSQTI